MKIEEILSITDIEKKISLLKGGRRTQLPNISSLLDAWDPKRHEIIWNKEKYPDRKVLEKEEEVIYDESSGKSIHIDARYKTEPINRISIPLEQDIVNVQTAFTIGTEPTITCDPANKEEYKLYEAVKSVLRVSKIRFQNKKLVRSWLSEQEVAEYWYAVKDDSFWNRLRKKTRMAFGGKVKPSNKLRSVVWSPFRGDTLYPYFDEAGDMIAFSREYKARTNNGDETHFMTITDTMVYMWNETTNKEIDSFPHGFSKLPVIYAYRPEAYCEKIKTFRVRLEKLLSNYGDCVDYHFFPILKLVGDVTGFSGKSKSKMVQLENGADAQYLTWEQVPDTVKYEAENLIDMAYSMTNTPRISFESVKGLGNTSGTAFRFMFMGAHMAVSNHAEVVEEFLQRRINFLISALGCINPTEFREASRTIDIETEIIPFMIDDLKNRVSTAIKAISGGIWSKREGIIFAGNVDRLEDELQEIEEEQS